MQCDEAENHESFLREQRNNDLRAMAATPQGRRILASMVCDGIALGGRCDGDSYGVYQEGRRHVAVELRNELKEVLSREAFIKIIYPMEE